MRNSKQKSSERGAALVELAIVLPFLLLLLMGMIEFGLLFYNQQVLTNSSREGARAGIAHLSESEIKDIAVNYCNDRLITFGAGPNVIPDNVEVVGFLGSYPDNLTVTISYKYTFFLPQLLKFGADLTLVATTMMNMEVEEE